AAVGAPCPLTSHDRRDPGTRLRGAVDRVHRAGAEARPGNDPGGVPGRSDLAPHRSGPAPNPSEFSIEARGDRLRLPDPGFLRDQWIAVRPARAVRQPVQPAPAPGLPACSARVPRLSVLS